jgi:GNAT superfamily N-acetyltransferase
MELELLDITIDVQLENFNSSNPSLDVYLKIQAYFEHIMHLCNTKLVKINDDIVAFFTMEFRTLGIPIDYDDNIYPVVCLKCLAVDDRFQGKGIGTAIIQYVVLECKELSKFIGCRCLIIDAIKEKVNWYKDRGFQLVDSEEDLNKYDITVPMFIDFRDNELVVDYFDEEV